MKLSIIIPCYNAEQYVFKCIDKLEEQLNTCGLGDEAEIIMVDDGSTDNTYNSCISVSKKYNNIKIFYHEGPNGEHINLYQAKTRALGVKNATGDWITFLDVDDYYDDSVNEFLGLIDNCTADIIFAGYKTVIDEKVCNIVSAQIEQKDYLRNDFAKFLQAEISFDQISCIGGKLYSRTFLERNGIVFRDEYRHNEDAGFAIEALLYAERIRYSELTAYLYIQRAGSMMHKYRDGQYFSINRVYSLLEQLYLRAGVANEKKNDIVGLRAGLAINTLLNTVENKKYDIYVRDYNQLKAETKLIDDCIYAIDNKVVNVKKILLLKFFVNDKKRMMFIVLKLFSML